MPKIIKYSSTAMLVINASKNKPKIQDTNCYTVYADRVKDDYSMYYKCQDKTENGNIDYLDNIGKNHQCKLMNMR